MADGNVVVVREIFQLTSNPPIGERQTHKLRYKYSSDDTVHRSEFSPDFIGILMSNNVKRVMKTSAPEDYHDVDSVTSKESFNKFHSNL